MHILSGQKHIGEEFFYYMNTKQCKMSIVFTLPTCQSKIQSFFSAFIFLKYILFQSVVKLYYPFYAPCIGIRLNFHFLEERKITY